MAEPSLDHPDRGRLVAFGRGTLNHDEMTELEGHLSFCEPCCQLLSALPDDGFVDLLRLSEKHVGLGARDCNAARSSVIRSEIGDVVDLEVASSFVLPGWHAYSQPEASLSAVDLVSSETSAQELPAELAVHPRYRIVKRLGSGGMGTVYLAAHRLMDRLVALKVIRRDLLENEMLVERFRREVRAAARLALHPNIVAAYDADQAGDSHFLVMEFVEGVDLAHLVTTLGPLPCALACQAVKQVAEGLEHAFQCGMVHRDIKPQNLMRTPDGQVKILDFGLARFASEALPDLLPGERETNSGTEVKAQDRTAGITLTDMVLGTADYISPEQASAPRSADIRADVYSLGCTLYYLLTGHHPFPGGSLVQKLQAHRELTPEPLTEARADVSPSLARIVDRMMAKDRSLRFQRPSDVAEALAPFADDKAAYTETVDLQVPKPRNVHVIASPSEFAGEQISQGRSPRGALSKLIGLAVLLVGGSGSTQTRSVPVPAATAI